MVFSSAVFLWLFLPTVFVVNLLLPKGCSNAFLLLASLVFYAWGEPYYILLMLASILVNTLTGRAIRRYPRAKRLVLFAGVAANLAMLGYYKYAAFAVGIVNALLGRALLPVPAVTLPIGISFFTFQAISYICDVYRDSGNGDARPDKLINVALYISFFPQLIAGPIVQYRSIDRQIEHRSVTAEKAAAGFRRFTYGLAKKILIANILGKTADAIFARDVMTIGGRAAWIGALFYTFQIYYDFSGYSDMAIGLGGMFGFTIPENFNYPYLSRSVGEFWRRWHISLGAWFREYVYIPLGGNRKGTLRTYVNLSVVFFLTGLWHGASFAFVAWGLYHGFFSVLERAGLSAFLQKRRALSHVYLLAVVVFGWVLFRCGDLMTAAFFIKRMLLPWQYARFDAPLWTFLNNANATVFAAAVLGSGFLQRLIPPRAAERLRGSLAEVLLCAALLLLCLASLASDTYNPFIYFQF